MSSIVKFTVAAAAVATLMGCASQPEEVIIVEPAPVVMEPVSGKF